MSDIDDIRNDLKFYFGYSDKQIDILIESYTKSNNIEYIKSVIKKRKDLVHDE